MVGAGLIGSSSTLLLGGTLVKRTPFAHASYMEIRVRYFAAARDLAGCAEERVVVEDGATGAVLLVRLGERHPRLAAYGHRMRLAVNGDFAPLEQALGAEDEVVLLPPVAGGAPEPPARLVDVRATPLSIDEALRAVSHPAAGGVAIFVGVVRDHAEGGAVARLDYEAYTELARKEMGRVLAGVEAERPGTRLAAVHRVGELVVGDLAVVVAASAPHRAEAFAACRDAIDRIKATVPVWKKEWAPDGSAVWVNLEGG